MLSKFLAGVLVLGVLLLTYPVGKKVVDTIRSGTVSQVRENKNYQELSVPQTKDLLSSPQDFKTTTVKKTLTLEAKNTVVFRDVVTGESVGKAMQKIAKVSRNLPKSQPIYLVLDTPGGAIFDGADFIDFIAALPQEVKTVTLFAASMGFQIVENNPGERLIVRNGMLMSHRATGGVEGQFNGELETRYRMVKRKIDYLDTNDANRVGMSYDQYQAKVKDEWWIHGFDAVDQKVADSEVLIVCGDSLDGTENTTLQTLFGPVTLVFSQCPLLKEPVSIDFSNISKDAQPFVKSTINDLIYDKVKFVKQIILTNKFYTIFK